MTSIPVAASAAGGTPVTFSEDWVGVRGVFGGRVIAAVLEHAAALPDLDGLEVGSVHVEFTGGALPGEASLVDAVVHRGRSTATVEVTCSQEQDGKVRRVVGSSTKFVARAGAPTLAPHRLPEVPAPDDLLEFDPPWGALSYDLKFDVRFVSHALEDGVPTTRAWLRARPGTGLGRLGTVAALLDVLPPGLFMREPLPQFVPTVDFSMHVDALAVPEEGEWVLGVMRTEWADEAFCLETSTLHRADGRYVARGTQNRRVVR